MASWQVFIILSMVLVSPRMSDGWAIVLAALCLVFALVARVWVAI